MVAPESLRVITDSLWHFVWAPQYLLISMEKLLAEIAISSSEKTSSHGYFKPLTTLQLEDTNRHAIPMWIDLQISKRQNLAFGDAPQVNVNMMCNYNTHAIQVCKRMPSKSFSRGKNLSLAQSHKAKFVVEVCVSWQNNGHWMLKFPLQCQFFWVSLYMKFAWSYTYTYSYFTIDYFLHTKPPVKVTNVVNYLTKASIWVNREEK